MKKMDVNFIITCFNREDYWPFLKKIISSYEKINPKFVFCYSGEREIEADFKCLNRGHIEGDTDLIIGGYNYLKNNGVKNWIKLSVDSWMLDEVKIIEIFEIMEKDDLVYAGNYWTGKKWWSTDIFFARENSFEFMKKFTEGALNYIENVDYSIEGWIRVVAESHGGYYIIPEREPITGNTGNRFFVDELSWTMKHDLAENIETANNYIETLRKKNPNLKIEKL